MGSKIREVKYTPDEAEKVLKGLVGSWEGTTTTWFEPGSQPDVSPMRGTIRPLPGSRFVIHEYQSSIGGEGFQGIVIYGFNTLTNAFEMAWADSFHMSTNIMFSTGPGLENGFSVLGSYKVDPAQEAWGWRVQVERVDADHLTITSFNILPDGQEYKGVETLYTRVSG